MADEITYEVLGKDGMGNMVVKYSLGEHSMEFGLPWHGEGDLDEFIKRYTPRQQLRHMAAPPVDVDSIRGHKGTADMEVPPPVQPEIDP